MSSKTYFQHGALRITDASITAGDVTIFYPNISAVYTYSGRPYLMGGIVTMVVALLGLFFVYQVKSAGDQMVNSFAVMTTSKQLPATQTSILYFLPQTLFTVVGFCAALYNVNVLFITTDGQRIAILRDTDMSLINRAKQAVETAKANFSGSSIPQQSTNTGPVRLKPI